MGGYIKPHRKPNRLNKWNYNNFGFYFVTICTKDRQEYFGNVYNGMVELNEIGKLAYKCWQEIKNHFTGVSVDEFVIMPNHVHGIILLTTVGNRHACSLQDNRQYQLLPTIMDHSNHPPPGSSTISNLNFNFSGKNRITTTSFTPKSN